MLHLGLEIQEALNGFIVLERATFGANLCGEPRTHVFNSAEQLTVFIKEHFAREMPEGTLGLGAEAGLKQQAIGQGILGGQFRNY